jgi:uncharacterized GH25 family protein
MSPGLAALLLLLGAAAVGSPAAAHEFWLSPSAYRAAAGDTIAVSAFVGTGFRGERRPYAPSRVASFTLRAARTLDLARAAVPGGSALARFVAADSGGAMVAYLSRFATLTQADSAFDAYLALEGLDTARAARDARGAVRNAAGGGAAPPGFARERYRRCAKTWIAGSDPARALVPVGLPLEIVPLGVPGAAESLDVQVLFEGRALEGALVRAWRAPLGAGALPTAADTRDSTGAAAAARTDASGRARLATLDAGEWVVGVVHMVPSRDAAEADWESAWASLTFAAFGPSPAP